VRGRRYYNGVCGVVTARYCGRLLLAGVLIAAGIPAAAQSARPAGAGPAPAPPAAPAAPEPPAAPGFELLAGGSLDVRWITADGEAVAAPPALDDEAVYVPMKRGQLVAFDLDSGRVRWAVDAETPWAPAVGDGRVFLAMSGGVRAVDASTGRVLWQRPLPAPAAAPPYWDTGWLIVSLAGGDLAAFRAADGELLWQAPLGSVAQTAPVPALAALYLGLADGRVVALDLATGRTLWTRPLDGTATGILALDDQIVVGTTARAVHSLDLTSGRSRWRWRVGGAAVGAAAADERTIYLVAYDHLLRAVDRRSGNLRWRRALPHRPAGSPLLAGRLVLVPSLSTEIAAYDAATGAPALAIASAGEVAGETRMRHGGTAAGTRLLAVSVEGRLLAFAPRVEPVPAALEALPGVAVPEPAVAATTPSPPSPGPPGRR
jgi:outer membrane protein assembly factor BamB